MKREDFLKAFTEMSPEDQESIRAELTKQKGSEAAGGACGPAGMMKQMMEMMETMKAGGDPLAMCREMMAKKGGSCC